MATSLGADRARIADIDAQIVELENTLALLQTERKPIQERIDSYKYPILTLPNEITSEIFIHFLPVIPLFPSGSGILSPTVLTRVCRTWRDIALTTPALWSAILVSPDEKMMPTDLLLSWLARSGSYPLSIRIGACLDARHDLNPFLEAIAPHSARWEHLDLTISPSYLAFFTGPMGLLRSVKLIFTSENTFPSNVTAFPELPLLRTATLDYVTASTVILPWAQLTSLTLNVLLPAEYVPILNQTINLVQCELEIYDEGDGYHPGDITLRCLESLVLAPADRDMQPMGYLDPFILPALRRLEFPHEFLADPLVALRSLISRSQCTLETVRINGPVLTSKATYHAEFPSIPTFIFDPDFIHSSYGIHNSDTGAV
jgi:hypothetical protein